MSVEYNFFFVMDYVDKIMESEQVFESDRVAQSFQDELRSQFDDNSFSVLLIHSGFIPDTYAPDSSSEVLYSKLVEALVVEWADRMGFSAALIKEKSSREDVTITIGRDTIVGDAKSFRLSRSQKAPNVKDFVKPEDYRKWMDRHENAVGGLVTYPCAHEWARYSDVYTYCSSKETPIVMLPYKYLSYLLFYKDRFRTSDILRLWDYDRLFPQKLEAGRGGMGNKSAYWDTINREIVAVTNTSPSILSNYLEKADRIISECITQSLNILEDIKQDILQQVEYRVNNIGTAELREEFLEFKKQRETETINRLIENVRSHRMT